MVPAFAIGSRPRYCSIAANRPVNALVFAMHFCACVDLARALFPTLAIVLRLITTSGVPAPSHHSMDLVASGSRSRRTWLVSLRRTRYQCFGLVERCGGCVLHLPCICCAGRILKAYHVVVFAAPRCSFDLTATRLEMTSAFKTPSPAAVADFQDVGEQVETRPLQRYAPPRTDRMQTLLPLRYFVVEAMRSSDGNCWSAMAVALRYSRHDTSLVDMPGLCSAPAGLHNRRRARFDRLSVRCRGRRASTWEISP